MGNSIKLINALLSSDVEVSILNVVNNTESVVQKKSISHAIVNSKSGDIEANSTILSLNGNDPATLVLNVKATGQITTINSDGKIFSRNLMAYKAEEDPLVPEKVYFRPSNIGENYDRMTITIPVSDFISPTNHPGITADTSSDPNNVIIDDEP